MKKTEMKKNYSLKATIIVSLILAIILFILIKIFLNAYNNPEMEYRNFIMMSMGVFIMYIIISVLGSIKGILKAKKHIIKEQKLTKDNNPYLYYRELPNNFGIGVATLLMDSTIENEKDIIAVILDLCAKKYIKLVKVNDKYIISILKNSSKNLLSNESYILSLIKNNNLKNINYDIWYRACMQDGIDLGLYNTNNNTKHVIKKEINMEKYKKAHLWLSIFVAIIMFLGFWKLNGFLMASIIIWAAFFLTYAILFIPFNIIYSLISAINLARHNSNINYNNIISNHLVKTEKGINELQKLYSFKKFLEEFGSFVDKSPESVVLWDRYLSYAQVFGLTKEIMNTGYKELIENSSFNIDDINNISFQNIERL